MPRQYNFGTSKTVVEEDNSGNVSVKNVDSLSTEQIGSERHYAGSYSGADADTRLNSALSAASNGDVIYLEGATYSKNRVLSTKLTVIGTAVEDTVISGDWTTAEFSTFTHLTITGAWSVAGFRSRFRNIDMENSGSLTVDGSRSTFTGLTRGDVTFTSNSANCVIDTSNGISITNNGSNIVTGDIA